LLETNEVIGNGEENASTSFSDLLAREDFLPPLSLPAPFAEDNGLPSDVSRIPDSPTRGDKNVKKPRGTPRDSSFANPIYSAAGEREVFSSRWVGAGGTKMYRPFACNK
jgi:hypothetical protein